MLVLVRLFAITLAWSLVKGSQRDKIFFVQRASGEGTEKLLVVTWTESEKEIDAGCEFFTDKDLINEVIQSSNDLPIQTLSEDEMQTLQEDCTEISLIRRRRETEAEEVEYEDYSISGADINDDPAEANRRKKNPNKRRRNQNQKVNSTQQGSARQGRKVTTTVASENEIETTTDAWADAPTTESGYNGLPIIFPGTKWCGAGDRAKNYDDLGLHEDTDRCCRAHDNCNDTLAPGETRNNLTNKSPFTKLSCQCDHDFYNCLDRVDTVTSNTIGNMYFNILRRECYEKDYPFTKKCKKYRTMLKITCIEYERNTSAPKEYQWVKAKKYSKIPIPGPLTVTLPF